MEKATEVGQPQVLESVTVGASSPDDSSTPLFLRIAQTLEKSIADGFYPVSGMLPTETELCTKFGASRYTIREAQRHLAELGLVQRKAGAGTVVIARERLPMFVHRVSSLRGLLAYPENTYRELLSAELATVDHQLAQVIGCEAGREWFRIQTLRKSDDDPTPFCWGEFYIPPALGLSYDWPRIDHRTIHDVIRELGHHQFFRAEVEISATAISGAMTEFLSVREGAPALHILRRYFDDDGVNFTTTRTIHPEHRFVYKLEFSRDE
jgi:GntR family transcriptional regulator